MLPTLLAAPLLALAPQAPDQVTSAPPGDWVRPLPLPAPAQAPLGGIEHLLYDVQTNHLLPEPERYVHVARRILNESGLRSASQVHIDFDPGYEALVLHALDVVRDGQRLGRLDLERVQLLQRETQLEDFLYDGHRTALVIVPDVRVGDVIEWAYTVRGASPVFGGRHFGGFALQFPDPVARIHQRLLWPAGRPCEVLPHGIEVEPAVEPLEGGRELVWDRRDVPAATVEPDMPAWHPACPWVEVSEYTSWAEVAGWGRALFEQALRSDEGLRQAAGELGAGGDDPHALLLRALRSVQGDVRYFGVELGEGSHRPSTPAEVLARRYGDCKDKAVLLVALLRELGIEAHPALVSTTAGPHIEGRLPSPGAFDHVIVRATIEGDDLWVDPTLDEHGPLDEHLLLGYGLALVLEPGATGLEPLVPQLGEAASTEVDSHFVVDDSGRARLAIVTRYRGLDAFPVRAWVREQSGEQLGQACLDYLNQNYPTATAAAPVVVQDDPATGCLTLRENYTIPGLWEMDAYGSRRAGFAVPEVAFELSRPSSRRRETPFALPHPRNVYGRISVTVPGGLQVARAHDHVASPTFHATRLVTTQEGRLQVEWAYHSLADHVPPEAFAGYLRDLERAEDLMGYELDLSAPSLAGFGVAGAGLSDPEAIGQIASGIGGLAFLAGLIALGRRRPRVVFVGAEGRTRREGPRVVLENGAELPERCVRCNAKATRFRVRTMRWHSAWYYLLVPFGMIPYLIAARLMGSSRSVRIGRCGRHRLHHLLQCWANLALLVGGLALCSLSGDGPLAVGVLLSFLGLANAVRMSALAVRPTFMDERVAYLRGFGRPYLESLDSLDA